MTTGNDLLNLFEGLCIHAPGQDLVSFLKRIDRINQVISRSRTFMAIFRITSIRAILPPAFSSPPAVCMTSSATFCTFWVRLDAATACWRTADPLRFRAFGRNQLFDPHMKLASLLIELACNLPPHSHSHPEAHFLRSSA